MKLVRIYTDSFLAHLDIAKLSDEGIRAVIKDENVVSIYPVYAYAVGGIKVLVNDQDYERAQEVLSKNDFENLKSEFSEEELNGQMKCPYCGSANIFHNGSWLVGFFFLLLFFFPFTTKKSVYTCLNCGHKWKGLSADR